jgi:hypothetical protein
MNRHLHRSDGGVGEVVTVVFLTGVVLVLVLLLVLAGRGAEARTRIDHAAETSAQAAALQRSPDVATIAATTTAIASLNGLCDGAPQIAVDTSGWVPGGLVSVTIGCRIRTSDLAPLPLPGALVAHGSSAAVIDTFRDNAVQP